MYALQQTVSAEGFAGTAFSTNVPHTVRGRGARETKQCTDCHLSAAGDNNAWMGQLLMQGTGYLNLVGKYAWVAAGADGFSGVVVTETTEPQAVFGSDLHRDAYLENYLKHDLAGGRLTEAYTHPGRDLGVGLRRKADVRMVQQRGEYVYAACGEDGVRLFDVAFVDDKAFAQRITTAPVSPLGQRFHLPTKNANFVAAPATVAVDPTRTRLPENREGPIHPLFGYVYVADLVEGLILTGAAPVIDGDPSNNFLKREVTFNPDGALTGARHVVVVGHYAYVCADAGLVVVDIDDPTKPVVRSVTGGPFLKRRGWRRSVPVRLRLRRGRGQGPGRHRPRGRPRRPQSPCQREQRGLPGPGPTWPPAPAGSRSSTSPEPPNRSSKRVRRGRADERRPGREARHNLHERVRVRGGRV